MSKSKSRSTGPKNPARESASNRSNDVFQEFARVVIHDFQEPLRAVLSYAKPLVQNPSGKIDRQVRRFAECAGELSQKLSTFVQDLLTYSGVETQGLPFEPTDAEAALGNALVQLKPEIDKTRAKITHDPLPTVAADPEQMTQLFQRLIGNAIRFRGDSPPRIHVGAKRRGNNWIFSVSDNGAGFDGRQAERLFDLFQRLHPASGHGIGLAICKRIAERHGGRIWADAEPNRGATFHFSFPLKPSSPPCSAPFFLENSLVAEGPLQ